MKNILKSLGIVVLLIYIISLIVASVIDPEYNQISQLISDLTMEDYKYRWIMNLLFSLQAIILLFYSLYFLINFKTTNNLVRGAFALITISIGNLLVNIFPWEGIGSFSPNNIIHFISTCISYTGIFTSIYYIGNGFGNTKFKQYSRFIILVTIVLTLLLLILIPLNHFLQGLLQKVNLLIFLIWLSSTSIILLKK